jgi:hypothetical protein
VAGSALEAAGGAELGSQSGKMVSVHLGVRH